MANLFALILAIATLITGIIWCLERFKFAPAREKASNLNQDSALAGKTKPTWSQNWGSLFPVLLIVFIIRSFIYEPFQIPSGSMMPTLLIGDFILVEKFAYGLKDPISQTTLIPTGHPKRGDIAVFKYPKDPSVDYIKRVVGVPGDKVVYNADNKTVTVYANCATEQSSCQAVPISYHDITPSDWALMLKRNDMGQAIGAGVSQVPLDQAINSGIRFSQAFESLAGVDHRILRLPVTHDQTDRYFVQPGQSSGVWVVPAAHYFMMGDNRDDSEDSRYWGFVPEKNLVGKATIIWMSFKKQENEWPTGVRLSRIGLIH